MDMQLNEMQLDALKEVGNIGAGNAATALSQLLDRKIDMRVPEVCILPFDEIVKKIGNDEDIVVAVLLNVYGDAPGNLLFVMKKEKAQDFAKTMLQGFSQNSDEIYMSLFQEIGNILGNSYIGAIGKLAGMNLVTSIPGVAVDMLTAVLSSSFIDAEQYSDYVLAIDTNFLDGNNDLESGGNFFYIPKPGSLNRILTNLGLCGEV